MSSFSVCVIPRRPSSTLFPYTTLFRSGRVLIDGVDVRDLRLDHLRSLVATAFEEPTLFSMSARENLTLGRADATDEEIDAADRKSTRLNSSHVEISYAVFCLKKKKLDWIEAAVRAGGEAPPAVWLKFDSGMHRLGFDPAALAAARARLGRIGCMPIGLASHFADADRSGGIELALGRIRDLLPWEAGLFFF